MATDRVTVTNIGTCRIAEPLSAAKRSKLIKRVQENIYGFVHTTKEVLQQIRFCEGEALPDELAPYISAKGSYPEWQDQEPSDLYFIEISSIKEIHFNGFLLQINYLDNAFASRPELLQLFFRLYRQSDRPKRAAGLAEVPAFAEASLLEKQILLEGFVHQTSYDELRYDMAEITKILPGRVIFVSHVNVAGKDGAPIISRARLCDWLQQIAAEVGYELVDPTPLVVAYGRELALEDQGRDVNHYTDPFKEHYGKALVRQFCESGESAQPADEPQTTSEEDVLAEPSSSQRNAIAAMVARISEALKTGALGEATDLAEDLMRLEVQTSRTMYSIAKVLLKTKRLEEAVLWLNRAAAVAKDPTAPMYELIKCHVKLKNPQKTIAAIDSLFQIEGESVELLVLKRDALLKLSDYAGAAAVAETLIGRDTAAAYETAPALLSHGQLEAASRIVAGSRAAHLEVAQDIAFEAKLVKALSKAGKAALEAGDAATAASAWRSILLLEPEHPQAASRLARLVAAECAAAKEQLQLADMAGAAASYRRALEYNPNDVKALRGLARCYDQLQETAESAAIWERLGLLNFETDYSFRRAARFAARIGNVTWALSIYGRLGQEGIDGDTQTVIGSMVRKAVKATRLAFAGGNMLEMCGNAKAVLEVDPTHDETLRLLRTAQVDLARQSVAGVPSAGRLFARRMVGELHAILRDADRRAASWKLQPDAAIQAA